MPRQKNNPLLNPLIVADSSPLMALVMLDILEVLPHAAEAIWIPETVRSACLAKPGRPDIDATQQAI